jgi:drug/metabolite transporter (DMT)-like permease
MVEAWHPSGEWAAMATAVLWTMSALAWTTAGRHAGALAVSFLRLVLAVPMLVGYQWLSRGLWFPDHVPIEVWALLVLSGLIGFFAADLAYIKALLLIGPRLTLLLQAIGPPSAALIAWGLLGDGLEPRAWLGIGATLAGVSWVVLEQPGAGRKRLDGSPLPQPPAQPLPPGAWPLDARGRAQLGEPAEPASSSTDGHDQFSTGVVLAIFAAVAGALGIVLSKKAVGAYDDATAATFIRIVGALPGYVVLVTVVRRWPTVAAAACHRRAMTAITLGAVIGPFVGVVLSMVALRLCHAGVAATLFATSPVLILPVVIVLYKETVSLRAAGGAALSVAGVALLLWQ